jgi:hypothetical protein
VIKNEGYQLNQIYHFDETGLFWRNLPDNTQASKAVKTTPGRKISKERVSALLCQLLTEEISSKQTQQKIIFLNQ